MCFSLRVRVCCVGLENRFTLACEDWVDDDDGDITYKFQIVNTVDGQTR